MITNINTLKSLLTFTNEPIPGEKNCRTSGGDAPPFSFFLSVSPVAFMVSGSFQGVGYVSHANYIIFSYFLKRSWNDLASSVVFLAKNYVGHHPAICSHSCCSYLIYKKQYKGRNSFLPPLGFFFFDREIFPLSRSGWYANTK